MARVPRWAQKIVAEVAPDAPLRWHWSPRNLSTGHCRLDRKAVVVTAGNHAPFLEVKLVLLHELAHWHTNGDWHGRKFWTKAWELYRRFGIPDHVVLKRERALAGCRKHRPPI